MKSCLAKRYDLVLSLGYDCVPAAYLKQLGLRGASMPFDWAFRSEFLRRIDLLCAGFAGFLLKDDLRARPELVSSTGHLPYEDVASGLVLLHDFSRTVPLDDEYDAVRERYARRCRRLLERLRRGGEVLAIYNNSEEESLPADVLRAGLARLAASFPSCSFNLLVLRNVRERMREEPLAPDLSVVRAWFYPPETGFPGDVKVGNRIFGKIRLRGDLLKERRRVRWTRLAIYAVAAFIPVKKTRRRWREQMCRRHRVPQLGEYND